MAKTKTMRVAVLMLALTLITSCFVGGTLAKYTTGADGEDVARVAKWGVEAYVAGGVPFATEYEVDDENADDSIVLTVRSELDDEVLAPGTEGYLRGVALYGKPEVAVRITQTATVKIEGWEINGEFYCPLIVADISGLNYDSAEDFAAAIKEEIESTNCEVEPNYDLGALDLPADYAWAWSFECMCDEDCDCDAKDTALGNLETSPTFSIELEVVVEQID